MKKNKKKQKNIQTDATWSAITLSSGKSLSEKE